MRKFLFLPIIFISCVIHGSGTRIVTGEVSGGSNVKIGAFSSSVFFQYDNESDGDRDVVFCDQLYNESGTFTPVIIVSIDTDNTYSIELPSDPSTINNLIAWDDTNDDDIYDMPGETAYFPVKTVGGIDCFVKNFSYIEVTEVVTYIVNYYYYDDSELEERSFNDNFDAIGSSGFNFFID